MAYPTVRRKSPYYVRVLSSRDLHALCGSMMRKQVEGDLSGRQDWLWDACLSELSWRFTHPSSEWSWCTCSLCFVDRITDPWCELDYQEQE